VLNQYFKFESENFWLFPKVEVELSIPEGRHVMIEQSVCDVLAEDQQKKYCNDNALVGKQSVMTAQGELEPVK
jgi:hypothetical protein